MLHDLIFVRNCSFSTPQVAVVGIERTSSFLVPWFNIHKANQKIVSMDSQLNYKFNWKVCGATVVLLQNFLQSFWCFCSISGFCTGQFRNSILVALEIILQILWHESSDAKNRYSSLYIIDRPFQIQLLISSLFSVLVQLCFLNLT